MKIFLFCLIFFFFFALDKKWRDLNTNGVPIRLVMDVDQMLLNVRWIFVPAITTSAQFVKRFLVQYNDWQDNKIPDAILGLPSTSRPSVIHLVKQIY